MVAELLLQRRTRRFPAAALAVALLAGCSATSPAGELEPIGVSNPADPKSPGIPIPFPETGECDPSISVKADGPALLVRDPEALKGFTLERVLSQILDRTKQTTLTAEELLQRLFDTENTEAAGAFADNIHCDSASNSAFKNGPAVNCPRAEGALAKSKGLFTPGHPDYFAPVALVNRFDLTPQDGNTCGEYRIVFAKESGLTDPNDRLFLIFEGALRNKKFLLAACADIASFWADLQKVEDDPVELGARLETFYFEGLPGFAPLVDPNHFGLMSNDDDPYGAQGGQLRISQRMQDPWELRELRLKAAPPDSAGPPFFFAPVTVKNNPLPDLFDPSVETKEAALFRQSLLNSDIVSLAKPGAGVSRIRMAVINQFNAGESAVDGPAQTDYIDQAMSGAGSAAFMAQIEERISAETLGNGCPPDDPLTAESILGRATTQSCAGCHAPQRFLGAERKIGCGLVWPSTLGEVHIDEKGALSPALTDVFLPRRASVMATFLQNCDQQAIYENLQPGIPLNGVPPPP